jgi:hypothetical protein
LFGSLAYFMIFIYYILTLLFPFVIFRLHYILLPIMYIMNESSLSKLIVTSYR